MVKITYVGKRGYRSLRTRKGHLFGWNQGETIDVKDESLLEKLKGSNLVSKNTFGFSGNISDVSDGVASTTVACGK